MDEQKSDERLRAKSLPERIDELMNSSVDVIVIRNIPYIIKYIINPISQAMGKSKTPEPNPDALNTDIEKYLGIKSAIISHYLHKTVESEAFFAKVDVTPVIAGQGVKWYNSADKRFFRFRDIAPEIYNFVLRSIYMLSLQPNDSVVSGLISNDTLFYNYVLYVEFMQVIINMFIPDTRLFQQPETINFNNTRFAMIDLLTKNIKLTLSFQRQMMQNFCLYYTAKKRTPHVGRGTNTITNVTSNYEGFIEKYSFYDDDHIKSNMYYSLAADVPREMTDLENVDYYFLNYRPVGELMGYASNMMDAFATQFQHLQHNQKKSIGNLLKDKQSRMKYLYDTIGDTNRDYGGNVLAWSSHSVGTAGYRMRTKSNYGYALTVNRDLLGINEATSRLLAPVSVEISSKLFSITLDNLNVNPQSERPDYQSMSGITMSAFTELARVAGEYMSRAAGTAPRTGLQVPNYKGTTEAEENAKRKQIRTLLNTNEFSAEELINMRASLMGTSNNKIKYLNHNPVYKYSPFNRTYSTRDNEGNKQGISRRNSELTLIFSLHIYKRWFCDDAHTEHMDGTAFQKFNDELEQSPRMLFLKKGRQTGAFSSGESSVYTQYASYLKKFDHLSLKHRQLIVESDARLAANIDRINVTPAERCREYEKKNPIFRGFGVVFNTRANQQYNLNRIRSDGARAASNFQQKGFFNRIVDQVFDTNEYQAAVRAISREERMIAHDEARVRHEERRAHINSDRAATVYTSDVDRLKRVFRIYIDDRIRRTDGFKNF